MNTIAVSTWSLKSTLRSTELIDMPAELHRRGFRSVQFCHFHLPSRDPGYLDDLRSALAAAEVELDAILIDDGDLTDPVAADDQQSWIAGWLDTAVALGANKARVIAGKAAPTPDRLVASSRRLVQLAQEHPDVRVVTENWFDLMPTAADVRAVLDPTDGQVGLLIDLGNWSGETKYDELAAVADLAETCHAKAHALAGDGSALDVADYRRSLQVLREVDYAGPLALVYDGQIYGEHGDDEWAGLEQERAVVDQIFG